MKTTILIDVNTLAIKDVHFTTQKAWDGHIGMQVFRRTRKTCVCYLLTRTTRGENPVKSVAPSQRAR